MRTVSAKAGIRTEIVPHMRSSLALWRLDLGSELVFSGDAGTTEPSRPSRRQGGEWSTRWLPVRSLLFDPDVAWSRGQHHRHALRSGDERFRLRSRRTHAP